VLHRVAPQRAQRLGRAGLVELPDRRQVALVERLVEELRGTVVPAGEAYTVAMQLVIGGALGRELGLAQNLAQLARREAGPDDRAVQMRRELPDPRPSCCRGSGNRSILLIRVGGAAAKGSARTRLPAPIVRRRFARSRRGIVAMRDLSSELSNQI
jgi:hypothetical protein